MKPLHIPYKHYLILDTTDEHIHALSVAHRVNKMTIVDEHHYGDPIEIESLALKLSKKFKIADK